MIAPPVRAHVWLAAGAAGLRRGFTGLSAPVQTALDEDPFSDYFFVFRGQRCDLLKAELLPWNVGLTAAAPAAV
jgi:hypothetical protein